MKNELVLLRTKKLKSIVNKNVDYIKGLFYSNNKKRDDYRNNFNVKANCFTIDNVPETKDLEL